MMPDIYSQAGSVLVWTGVERDAFKLYMQFHFHPPIFAEFCYSHSYAS